MRGGEPERGRGLLAGCVSAGGAVWVAVGGECVRRASGAGRWARWAAARGGRGQDAGADDTLEGWRVRALHRVDMLPIDPPV